jgi:uncharacterized protein YciI
MEEKAPEKLFICVTKMNQKHAEIFADYFNKGIPIPAKLQEARRKHVLYYEDLVKRGIVWLAGSWTDHTGGMQIFAVNSLEEAKKAQRNDPFFINGTMYDDTYHEWQIHTPLNKVAPSLREKVTRTLKECGVTSDLSNK